MSRLCHTCLLVFDPACVLTMSFNKAMRMDPHVSRLSCPVTIIMRACIIIMQVDILIIVVVFFKHILAIPNHINLITTIHFTYNDLEVIYNC